MGEKKIILKNNNNSGQSDRIQSFIKIRMFHLSGAFISHSHYTLRRSCALSFDHIDIVLRLYLEDGFSDW